MRERMRTFIIGTRTHTHSQTEARHAHAHAHTTKSNAVFCVYAFMFPLSTLEKGPPSEKGAR